MASMSQSFASLIMACVNLIFSLFLSFFLSLLQILQAYNSVYGSLRQPSACHIVILHEATTKIKTQPHVFTQLKETITPIQCETLHPSSAARLPVRSSMQPAVQTKSTPSSSTCMALLSVSTDRYPSYVVPRRVVSSKLLVNRLVGRGVCTM
ncbi:uncharacterized protein K460DRAFT_45363 [Cucurbitaria berberidis CBS 394.84]|uniref:Uncharacterized protein n=1 Tax=Cucurbitaria berberidis CBS 394.84 TaxID=1168544 RepID=A0A9P4GT13_9PLEO|nr:uncharacterized protein K460DRAFT_45363 [Cucurbitaria berberidis CBS 394.84]KAF1852013.1 hypothetical protein K460DRAFT_45363 [Cucurbitaria berberidis CBS 394.84]